MDNPISVENMDLRELINIKSNLPKSLGVTVIQRALRIGYNRAERLLEYGNKTGVLIDTEDNNKLLKFASLSELEVDIKTGFKVTNIDNGNERFLPIVIPGQQYTGNLFEFKCEKNIDGEVKTISRLIDLDDYNSEEKDDFASMGYENYEELKSESGETEYKLVLAEMIFETLIPPTLINQN